MDIAKDDTETKSGAVGNLYWSWRCLANWIHWVEAMQNSLTAGLLYVLSYIGIPACDRSSPFQMELPSTKHQQATSDSCNSSGAKQTVRSCCQFPETSDWHPKSPQVWATVTAYWLSLGILVNRLNNAGKCLCLSDPSYGQYSITTLAFWYCPKRSCYPEFSGQGLSATESI